MTDLKPADALKQHWTDALPRAWKPFAQLSRLDRPIGWQLLVLPCWMGIAVARIGFGFFWTDLAYAGAFLIGAIAMRGAGCTYNDILDQDIDAQVERTRLRPLPSGAVSLKAAWAWLLAQCLVGLGVLLTLPTLAQIVSLIAIPLVALYPLMKRITWWPQFFLGITFNWGAPLGFLAARGELHLAALLLYLAGICWTLAYDTIYALQDILDDAMIGVRSTARLFGHDRAVGWIGGFYAAALLLLAASGWVFGLAWPFFAALAAPAAHFAWQVFTLDPRDAGDCARKFRANRDAGLLVAAAILAGHFG